MIYVVLYISFGFIVGVPIFFITTGNPMVEDIDVLALIVLALIVFYPLTIIGFIFYSKLLFRGGIND